MARQQNLPSNDQRQTLYSSHIMSSNQYQMKLERAEAIVGYCPQKPQDYYIWEALQVAGSGQSRISGRSTFDGNKRLAIVGDAAMALALARPWYEKDEALGSSWCRHCESHTSDCKRRLGLQKTALAIQQQPCKSCTRKRTCRLHGREPTQPCTSFHQACRQPRRGNHWCCLD